MSENPAVEASTDPPTNPDPSAEVNMSGSNGQGDVGPSSAASHADPCESYSD